MRQLGASSASCSLYRFALGASGATYSPAVRGDGVLLAQGCSEPEDLWGRGQAGVRPRKESAGGKACEPPSTLALPPGSAPQPPLSSKGGFSKCEYRIPGNI